MITAGRSFSMISNLDICELFKMWEDGDKLSAMDLVLDCFEYNEIEFNIDEARDFVNDAIEEFKDMSFECNRIEFMVGRMGRDWLCVYCMDELDYIMDGWSASKVCEFCCHDEFSDCDNFFYFDDVYNRAHSVDYLEDAFEEYADLDSFIGYYVDEFEKFLNDWSDDNIEDIERSEHIKNEIGNIYMY